MSYPDPSVGGRPLNSDLQYSYQFPQPGYHPPQVQQPGYHPPQFVHSGYHHGGYGYTYGTSGSQTSPSSDWHDGHTNASPDGRYSQSHRWSVSTASSTTSASSYSSTTYSPTTHSPTNNTSVSATPLKPQILYSSLSTEQQQQYQRDVSRQLFDDVGLRLGQDDWDCLFFLLDQYIPVMVIENIKKLPAQGYGRLALFLEHFMDLIKFQITPEELFPMLIDIAKQSFTAPVFFEALKKHKTLTGIPVVQRTTGYSQSYQQAYKLVKYPIIGCLKQKASMSDKHALIFLAGTKGYIEAASREALYDKVKLGVDVLNELVEVWFIGAFNHGRTPQQGMDDFKDIMSSIKREDIKIELDNIPVPKISPSVPPPSLASSTSLDDPVGDNSSFPEATLEDENSSLSTDGKMPK